jgi:hypothetical protein
MHLKQEEYDTKSYDCTFHLHAILMGHSFFLSLKMFITNLYDP